MKKRILLVLLIMTITSCFNFRNRDYTFLEDSLISILTGSSNQDILNKMEKAAKAGNKEVYSLAYSYYGSLATDFLEKNLNKSNGEAEYYLALIMRDNNNNDDAIKFFERSADEGNLKAYYMLGTYYQDNLEFSKAQSYFEKGKEKGEIYSTYSYNFNKREEKKYKRIEELYKKFQNRVISEEEQKELGKLVLEVYSYYDIAYDILKNFIDEEYAPALYAKSKMLENENKEFEANRILNKLFIEQKYYLAGFEIAYKLSNNNNNYELAMIVLNDIKTDNSLILGYKGYLSNIMGKTEEAEKYYIEATKNNDVDIMNYLGDLYYQQNKLSKAKEVYSKAYDQGSIYAGYQLAMLLEEIDGYKDGNQKKNKQAKKILERLAASDDENAKIELSLYYKINDINVWKWNLRSAIRFNPVAMNNLGVYYYNKKDENKARIYFKEAVNEGFEILPIYEELLISKD